MGGAFSRPLEIPVNGKEEEENVLAGGWVMISYEVLLFSDVCNFIETNLNKWNILSHSSHIPFLQYLEG